MGRNGCFRTGWLWCGLLFVALIPIQVGAQIWENKVLIEGRDPVISQNGMAWDENGNLHLILTGDNLYHLWFDGQTWQEDRKCLNDDQSGYAWIAFGKDGLHFLNQRGGSLSYHTVTAAGWDSASFAYAYSHSNISPLKFDSLGNPHTVYNRYNGDILHAVFHGETWTNDVVASSDTDYREVGFDLDSRGNIRLCFVLDGQLIFRKFKGATWHDEKVLTGTPRKLMMKLDNQGIPHVIYIISDATGSYLGYSTRTTDGWQNEIIGTCSNQGTLTLSDDNKPHVVCNSNGLKHYYRTDDEWIEDAIADGAFQPYVSAGFDPDNRLTVCAVNTTSEYVALFRLRESNWEEENILRTGKIGAVKTVVDHHDVIHGIMMNRGTHQLEYGTIEEGNWVSEILTSDFPDASQLSIGVDGSDRIHSCYDDNRIHGLVHAVKTETGWQSESVCEECYFRSSQMAVGKTGILPSSLLPELSFFYFRR